VERFELPPCGRVLIAYTAAVIANKPGPQKIAITKRRVSPRGIFGGENSAAGRPEKRKYMSSTSPKATRSPHASPTIRALLEILFSQMLGAGAKMLGKSRIKLRASASLREVGSDFQAAGINSMVTPKNR
jgi:hypothetical protein